MKVAFEMFNILNALPIFSFVIAFIAAIYFLEMAKERAQSILGFFYSKIIFD